MLPSDIHEGTPLGSMEVLHGLQTYISNPKTPPSGKIDTIIMIPDIFGVYVNAKLLADDWAGQGYRVVMPDLLEGDPVPLDMLNVGVISCILLGPLYSHRGWIKHGLDCGADETLFRRLSRI